MQGTSSQVLQVKGGSFWAPGRVEMPERVRICLQTPETSSEVLQVGGAPSKPILQLSTEAQFLLSFLRQ